MVFADWGAWAGPVLTAAVLAVAAVLALRQRAERRVRAAGLTAEDRRYFARQDLRRLTGVAVLVLIGLGMTWGSQLDYRGDVPSKRLFLTVWLIVILLVLFLVGLALLDLLSTRLYARRHRRILAAERREALKAEFPQRSAPQDRRRGSNGQPPPREPPGGV